MNSKTENELNLLKLLYQVGEIRAADLSLYLFNVYDQSSSARRFLKRLLNEELIEKGEYEIRPTDNNKKGTDQVYHLTQKGKVKFLNAVDDPFYQSLKPIITPKGFGPESERTNRALSDVGIMAMFRACNVPVFMHEKPSLLYLRDSIVGSVATPKTGYLDNIDKQLCIEGLSSGIFYTASEYLDYIKSANPSKFDTIIGTRIRGLYISNTSCFAIYTSEKYNNRILKVNLKGEKGLIDSLETLRSFTKVYRALPTFDEMGLLQNGKTYIKERAYNKPYALIISDGESLAYATSTGNARGKHHKKDISNVTIGIENAFDDPSKAKISRQTTFLTAASSLYDKIYVVPSDANGFYELSYLLSHSLEDWKADGIGIIKRETKLFKGDEEIIGDFPYSCKIRGERIPITFVPVFEAKKLYKIANSSENPIIITNRHLLNMIAHSIKKEGHYYDYETMATFSKNLVYIYDQDGYVKGKRILEEELNKNGITFKSNKEQFDLPKKFGLSSEEFYNEIARGKVKVSDIVPTVETKKYVPKIGKHKKSVILNISMNADLAKLVKESAANENTSVSRFIANCLKEYIS